MVGNTTSRITPSPVARYYTVLNEYNNYRNEKAKKVCHLCFKSVCKHNLAKIQRKEGLSALSYWVDIAQMQAKDEMLWLGDDIVVPRFPIEGVYDPNERYDIIPRLSLDLTIINVSDDVSIFTNGKPDYIDLPSLGVKAIHFGVIFDDQFFSLKSFRNGSFFNPKGKFQKMLNLPEHANHLVEGFYYLRKGNSVHDEFARVSFVT